jgi:hypothetical protein
MPTEASVPHTIRNQRQLLELLAKSQQYTIDPPNVVVANGVALADKPNLFIRTLQNCGTIPVKWIVGSTVNPTSNSFHGVLAACTDIDDGSSSILDLSSIKGDVRILGVGGSPRVATFQAVKV